MLLQNATNIITKCDSYFITKCDRSLLENATVLLQNATVIAKCDVYYKLRQLLQNATFITNCDSTTSVGCFYFFNSILPNIGFPISILLSFYNSKFPGSFNTHFHFLVIVNEHEWDVVGSTYVCLHFESVECKCLECLCYFLFQQRSDDDYF